MGSYKYDRDCEFCGQYVEYMRDGHSCGNCGTNACDDCYYEFNHCDSCDSDLCSYCYETENNTLHDTNCPKIEK